MSERGARNTIRIGSVSAEVSLIKTSAKPREAQHDTRRVDEPGHVRMLPPSAEEVSIDFTTDPLGAPGDPEPPGGPDDSAFPPLATQGGRAQAEAAFTGATATAAEPADVERGVWRASNEDRVWVNLTNELAAIDERTILEGMEIAATVGSAAVPRAWVRDAYYVAPAGDGAPKVLALLWWGLRDNRAVEFVRWTKRTNQALGALVAAGTAAKPHLLLLELEWAANVRPVPPRAKLATALAATTERERGAASELVEAYRAQPRVVEELRDERAAQRAELLEAARNGAALPEAPAQQEQANEVAAFAAALA